MPNGGALSYQEGVVTAASHPGRTPGRSLLPQALAIARHQQAKSWELRASVDDWFIEGFDTADLLEAKALLEALA